MLVSPISGVQALRGHDCFCSEFQTLAPAPGIRQTTAFRAEFGVKEDLNSVQRRAGKDKPTMINL